MSCAMYLQCVGKHLESTYYAIKGIQIDTTTQGQLRDMPEDKSDINNTNMRPSSSNVTKSKCTEHNTYGIKSLCSSTAVLDLSSVTIGAIAGLLHTLSCSVSLWTEKDLDRIHALIPTLQNDYNTNTIDVIPQHIDISETKCQLVTLHKHNLTIPKTSSDVNKLTNILKKIYDSKWRYLLLSTGKLSKTIVILFILGSKIYIFEPHSYIPTTLGLSGLTYCSTPMSCAMYLQCVGKHLQFNIILSKK